MAIQGSGLCQMNSDRWVDLPVHLEPLVGLARGAFVYYGFSSSLPVADPTLPFPCSRHWRPDLVYDKAH